jgi:hypothetical protein
VFEHLDQQLLNDPQRPVDELLRWHFRQSVLANMRGTGEPIFEHNFPPGSDIVGDILGGPIIAERMEVELFNLLTEDQAAAYEGCCNVRGLLHSLDRTAIRAGIAVVERINSC